MANSVEVVICRCRGAVTNNLDLERLAKLMAKNKRIAKVHVLDNLCLDGMSHMAEVVSGGPDTGLVVAACAAKPLANKLSGTLRALSIPAQACEIVPVRDWVLWAHPGGKATEAANDYIRMATARVKAAKDTGHWSADHAVINKLSCDKCKRCVEECPVKAYTLDEDGYPSIHPERCQQCGICVGSCPKQVISLPQLRIEEISASLRALKGDGSEEPTIAAFCCEPLTYPALRAKAAQGMHLPGNLRLIKVPCMGAVNMSLISDTLSTGIDGALLFGCQDGPCRARQGNELAIRRLENLRETLERMMVDTERVKYVGWPETTGEGVSVDPARCNGCGTCASVCPFGAVVYEQVRIGKQIRQITGRKEQACRGCGVCTAACPSGACHPRGKTDKQLFADIDAACWGTGYFQVAKKAILCDCQGLLRDKIDFADLSKQLYASGFSQVIQSSHLCGPESWQEIAGELGLTDDLQYGVIGACAAGCFGDRMRLYRQKAGLSSFLWPMVDLWEQANRNDNREQIAAESLRLFTACAARAEAAGRSGFQAATGDRDLGTYLREHMQTLRDLGPNPFKE